MMVRGKALVIGRYRKTAVQGQQLVQECRARPPMPKNEYWWLGNFCIFDNIMPATLFTPMLYWIENQYLIQILKQTIKADMC